MSGKKIDLYVDGSVNTITGNVGWAFALVGNNKLLAENLGKLTNPHAKKVRQVSGELAATVYGLETHFSSIPNIPVDIFYDYNGIYFWVCDLFSKDRAWKRKNRVTEFYRTRIEKIIESNGSNLITFSKVKSHSGVYWNEYVDKLAKKACGVQI
jgi:ribonuclease HI